VGKHDELHGSLIQIDVWVNDWRKIKLAAPNPDCPACGKREFEFLDAETNEFVAVLCGREAVQIAPPRSTTIELDSLSDRLGSLGPVEKNNYLVRFSPNGVEMTIFTDGRAIIKGTDDVSLARSLYAKYIGN
jgi:adenylyltransferase/sulfurtransferase